MNGLICPRCGKTDQEAEFVESFCVDCMPLKLELPKEITIEKCKRCENMHLQGRWMLYRPKAIEDYIKGKCKGDFEKVKYDIETQQAEFEIVRGSSRATVKRSIPLIIRENVCSDCIKISGGYYEAIVQLRGNRRKIEKMAKEIMKKLEGKTFLTKIEELEEGLNLYYGRSKTVLGVINDFGYRVLMSKKLVGRDDRGRLYRTTFLVRIDEPKGRPRREKDEEKDQKNDDAIENEKETSESSSKSEEKIEAEKDIREMEG